ncbi:hypothetical protein C8Q77DRAFT_1061265 [Trametes polyzona]|nr:hypothetical protein C8Q77DRAFT_1061265 [Trametes polyzona]
MQSPSSLLPGYKQVEAFGSDEDYESGEEVEYVTLDLGTIEPTLVPSSSTYRLIGLDTPTPYLQLSGTKLKGRHQSLLGTELLFTETSDDQHPHAQGKRPLVHVASTERRIRFKEVEIKPKGEGAPPDGPSGSTTKSSTVAKKVQTQMDHVMGTQTGSSRRGRGGKKRGGTSKIQTRSKGKAPAEELQAEESHIEDTPAEEAQPPEEPLTAQEPHVEAIEVHPRPFSDDVLDPALTQMDTSSG